MAARGSIIYFLIVEMTKVNVMYQTALRQFLNLYDDAISKSKPTHIIEKRIVNIEDYLTKSVWKYNSRGLYEKHKFLFTLLLALKIDLSTEKITYQAEWSITIGPITSDSQIHNIKYNFLGLLHGKILNNKRP